MSKWVIFVQRFYPLLRVSSFLFSNQQFGAVLSLGKAKLSIGRQPLRNKPWYCWEGPDYLVGLDVFVLLGISVASYCRYGQVNFYYELSKASTVHESHRLSHFVPRRSAAADNPTEGGCPKNKTPDGGSNIHHRRIFKKSWIFHKRIPKNAENSSQNTRFPIFLIPVRNKWHVFWKVYNVSTGSFKESLLKQTKR